MSTWPKASSKGKGVASCLGPGAHQVSLLHLEGRGSRLLGAAGKRCGQEASGGLARRGRSSAMEREAVHPNGNPSYHQEVTDGFEEPVFVRTWKVPRWYAVRGVSEIFIQVRTDRPQMLVLISSSSF